KREKPGDHLTEYQGVPRQRDRRENPWEVRQEARGPAGRRGGPGDRPPVGREETTKKIGKVGFGKKDGGLASLSFFSMAKINSHYQKLQAGYLFPEIGRRVRAFAAANPEARIIRLGIGDVVLPLPAPIVT